MIEIHDEDTAECNCPIPYRHLKVTTETTRVIRGEVATMPPRVFYMCAHCRHQSGSARMTCNCDSGCHTQDDDSVARSGFRTIQLS